MRYEFFLLPIAVIASQPSLAQSMVGVEQSQARMFPGATMAQNFITLTDQQAEAIRSKSQIKMWGHDIKAWKASTGGWYILDKVLARDAFITYALALDQTGVVTGVEILQCEPHYDISNPAWLRQFRGKRFDTPNWTKDIHILSGASLSSDAVTDGVKRLFATYELVLAADTH
jgi:hypothetical protein